MRRLLHRLGGCQRGLATTEFAMVAPLLILFHLGTVELVQTWEAHRRAAHVAAALADLTAQNQAVSTAQLTDIFNAGALLMAPFPATSLGARISSFTASPSGAVGNPDWTASSNWTAGGSPSVPNGYLQAGESVIVADVTYRNQSLFGLVMPKVFTIQSHAYLRPRLSGQVVKS
jgi:Flp pilus assembly protein TadG